jgi:hypothetical protein
MYADTDIFSIDFEIYDKQPLTASFSEAVRGCFNRGLLENVSLLLLKLDF